MYHLSLAESGLEQLNSLTKWMDLFGFFYYVASGMYALLGMFLISFSFITAGGNFYLLFAMGIIMGSYCLISIKAGKSLFVSSDNFLILSKSGEGDKDNILEGLEQLKKFFLLYGSLITLSFVWIFFLI